MDHLDDMRLTILAIDAQSEPSEREIAHLVSCPRCAANLAEERQLTAAIKGIAPRLAPIGFAERTATRFIRATTTKVVFMPSLIFGIILAMGITSAMLWTIIANPSIFATEAALAIGETAAFFKAMYLVVNRVPYASELLTTTSGAMVLIAAGMLAGLTKRAQAVK
ncbi:MAG: hypothetical protein QNJ97_03145 [Myxococcota bacterium]|nr:hypothetical protein [Myxococcota bacterium]